MGIHYLIFWRGCIVISLALGAIFAGVAFKYYYNGNSEVVETDFMTIEEFNIVADELNFSSSHSNCNFKFSMKSLSKEQAEELLDTVMPTQASVTFVTKNCSQFLDVAIIEINGIKFGSVEKFKEKGKNNRNVYIFFSVICFLSALLSLVMLKVSTWLINKQAKITTGK